MTGGSINHIEVAEKFLIILGNHLKGRGCEILTSDARINTVRPTDYFSL
jgi:hypothetical protein